MNGKIKTEKLHKEPKKKEYKWMLTIIILSFALTFFIGLLTERVSDALPLFVAFLTLIAIIVLGIVFDIFGVAVNVANVKQFHAMAANHVAEARFAVFLCRHSEKSRVSATMSSEISAASYPVPSAAALCCVRQSSFITLILFFFPPFLQLLFPLLRLEAKHMESASQQIRVRALR